MKSSVYLRSDIPFLRNDRPLIMAHRGRSAYTPESSYQSFKEAYDLDVDVLETDIRLTKDGIPVIFHDESLDRTTNGIGPIIDYTFDELQAFDLGYWYQDSISGEYPYRNKEFKILSLVEFLDKFPKIRINLDIKDELKEAPENILDAIISSNAIDRVLLGSFHHKQIRKFRDICIQWRIPTSASPLEVLAFLGHFTLFSHKKFCAFQVPIKYNFLKIVTPRSIKRAHKWNLAVHPWTINDEQAMMNLLNLGIDGIFTDDPGLLLKVWNSYRLK
ncbi:MAG: glycerophosphodiester phosphodiesterase [Candidatus Heimdallarchaeota archaeon]|nr:glycerophosphodiester phosphodiesterase [Candidatus Heimdallarchaeota archaeon]